jgi:hypothetical protein
MTFSCACCAILSNQRGQAQSVVEPADIHPRLASEVFMVRALAGLHAPDHKRSIVTIALASASRTGTLDMTSTRRVLGGDNISVVAVVDSGGRAAAVMCVALEA